MRPLNHIRNLPLFFALESLVLLGSAPLLLFPSAFPILTGLALLALIGVWLAYLKMTGVALRPTPLNASLLLFCFTLLISILVSADFEFTLSKASGLILGLAIWRYCVLHLRSKKQLWLALFVYALLGLGMISFGFISTNWLDKVPLLQPILSRLPARLISFASGPADGVHSNQLAGTLLFVLPLAVSGFVGWWRAARSRWELLLLGGITLFVLFIMLLTQSRGGWIASMASLLVFVWLWTAVQPHKSRWKPLVWWLPALAIAGAVLVVWRFGWARIQAIVLDPPSETAVGTLGTLSFRLEVWRWAIVALQDFPFTGTGLGTFRAVAFRLYPIAIEPSYDLAHAHNIFLQVGLDLGLGGLIAYLATLGLVGWMGWRAARLHADLRPFIVGLLASLIALHIYGLTDALALGSKPALLFWFALGLLTSMYLLQRAPKASQNQ